MTSNARVGLENYGATCYLNSTIQALYRTKLYRVALQQLPQNKELLEEIASEDYCKASPNTSPQQTIQALQHIFSLLQFSSKQYVETKPFCYAKGMDSKAMMIQEDANELFKHLVDNIDSVSKAACQTPLFKQYFEAEQTNVIRCQSCGYQSVNTENVVDRMCTVGHTLFESLATFIRPEVIEGYKCDGCKQQVNALKYVKLTRASLVFIVSVMRFAYDMYTDQYKKDSSPTAFPLAIDLEFLQYVDTFDFTVFQDIEAAMAEALRIIFMPWIFIKNGVFVFDGIDPKIVANVQKIPGFVERSLSKYTGEVYDPYASKDEKQQIVENSDPIYEFPVTIVDNNEFLYALTQIICHMGSINSGHYYCLSNEIEKQEDQKLSLKMWEYNDTAVFAIPDAVNQLNYIAGSKTKPMHLVQSESSQPGSPKKQDSALASPSKFQLDGYGNTGYMYFYENVKDRLQSVDKCFEEVVISEKVRAKIQQENAEYEEVANKIKIYVLTNIQEDNSKISAFAGRNESGDIINKLEIQGDLRWKIAELLEHVKQQISIKTSITPELFNNIKIYQCENYDAENYDFELARTKIVFQTGTDIQSKLNELATVQPNFRRFDQKKSLALFVEFVPQRQSYVEFDLGRTYVRLQQVRKSDEKPSPRQIQELGFGGAEFKNCLVFGNEQLAPFLGKSVFLPVDLEAGVELLEKWYGKREAVDADRVKSTYLNVSMAQFKCCAAATLGVSPGRLHIFDENATFDRVEPADQDRNVYLFAGKKYYFEVLGEDVDCGIISKQPLKKLMMVSELYRQATEFKHNVKITLYDQDQELVTASSFRPKQTFEEVVNYFKDIVGESEFGIMIKIVKVLKQQYSQYSQDDTYRLKGLVNVYPFQKDVPQNMTVEKLLAFSKQYGSLDINLQFGFVEPKANNIIQFVLINSNNNRYFSTLNNFVSYQNGQVIQDVFLEKIAKCSATINQLDRQRSQTKQLIKTPISELLFFYFTIDTSKKYLNGQQPLVLKTDCLMNDKPLNLALYKKPFQCFVVQNCSKQVFDFKVQGQLVQTVVMEQGHNVYLGLVLVTPQFSYQDVVKHYQQLLTHMNLKMHQLGYRSVNHNTGKEGLMLLQPDSKIYGNSEIFALVCSVI